MTTPPLILDRLWHSLCPAFAHLPTDTRRALLAASTQRPTTLRPRGVPSPARCARHSSTAQSPIRYTAPGSGNFWGPKSKNERDYRIASVAVNELDHLETSNIYYRLRRLAVDGNVDKVNRMVSYLLSKRGEEPNMALYSAVILANTSPEHGSAARAASLLKEIGEAGLEPTAEICHDMLKVLATHPDYLLREAITEYMRQRWFNLSAEGHHDVVVGLLRERQFEMALSRMDLMVSEGIEIRSWLYDMAIYMLCDVEEVDEALRIVQQRVEAAEHGISKSVWFNLLDVASSTYNHAAIQYIWRRQVEPGYLNPSSGICLNILATVARYGDAQLATGVFSLLSERKEVFTKQHYEMLVDTYIQAGDMRTALSVLCIMQSSGTPPDDYSTRKLFRWVRAGTERAREMFDHLRSLKDEGHTVPLAAFNALLEASIYRTDLDQAIDLYKALHTVCENGPTTETFNILFRGCPKRKDLAMFLAAEMVERNVEPDALTYDRLLLICLMEQDNYDDAFRYYEEMRSRGWTPRAGTFIAMARRCARAQDPRAWELVDVMRECGVDAHSVRFVREWLDANWGKVSEADPDLTR